MTIFFVGFGFGSPGAEIFALEVSVETVGGGDGVVEGSRVETVNIRQAKKLEDLAVQYTSWVWLWVCLCIAWIS